MNAGLLRRLVKSPYLRSIATLSGGQSAVVVITALAAPILGRLYLPSHYGMLAVYTALGGVFAGLSTLQYQNGVIAESTERNAEAMVWLSIAAAAAMAVVAGFVGLVAWHVLGRLESYAPMRLWVLLLPLSTISLGFILTVEALANRRARYGELAFIHFASATTTVSVSITLGLSDWGAHGLFTGYFAGELIRTLGHLMLLRKSITEEFGSRWRRLYILARRHSHYPRFSLPAAFMGSLTLQVPVFALGALGAVALLGSFSRAERLVALPFLLAGTAAAQVFRQRASDEWRRTGSCRPIFIKTSLALAAVAVPPVAVLMLFGPDLFRIILGPNWTEAGYIAQILAPMLFLRLVASPLEQVFQFTGQQKVAFRLNLIFSLLVGCGCLIPLLLRMPAASLIYGFSVSYSIAYALSFAFSWKHTVREAK